MKRLLLIISVLVVFLSACTVQESSEDLATKTVAVTFYPLYDLTNKIVGDDIEVFSVVPHSVEPHSFELTPRIMASLVNLDAYVALGIEFEPFEEQIVDSLESDIRVIMAARNVETLDGDGHDHDDHGDSHESHESDHDEHSDSHDSHESDHDEHSDSHDSHESDHDDHSHIVDPHVWLSPLNMKLMAEEIALQLSLVYPENSDLFNENLEILVQQLEELDLEYREGLNSCSKDTILVTHNAFSYLGEEYNFEIESISGLSHEQEPNPRQMARLVELARDLEVEYVFYEELVSPSVAQTIAQEAGIDILQLNPIEGTLDEDQDYFSLMRNNLNNLRLVLDCE